MKDILIILIAFTPKVACIVGAILLAMNGISIWGWFLLAGLLIDLRINFN
jgi:phage tail protein X